MHHAQHNFSTSIIVEFTFVRVTSGDVSICMQPRKKWSTFEITSKNGPGQTYILKSDSKVGLDSSFKPKLWSNR